MAGQIILAEREIDDGCGIVSEQRVAAPCYRWPRRRDAVSLQGQVQPASRFPYRPRPERRRPSSPFDAAKMRSLSARTSASSMRTMRAPSVPAYWSVAWTNWPPGAEIAPATWPASIFGGVADVEQYKVSASRRFASRPASVGRCAQRRASLCDAFAPPCCAQSRIGGEISGARRFLPLSQAKPARLQPMVRCAARRLCSAARH